MSVPAMLSNPGLALQGACFDLDDLQAMIDDYEGRLSEERERREKAEAHLNACLARVDALDDELAKVKNLVMGALAKVQGAPVAVPPPTLPESPPLQHATARSIPAPRPKAAPAASAPRATPPPALKAAPPAPKATPQPEAKPRPVAGHVPFSPPPAQRPTLAAAPAKNGAAATTSDGKPKRRIMRSRR